MSIYRYLLAGILMSMFLLSGIITAESKYSQDRETLLLARLIDAEAHGKSLICKVAIGAVILNRTDSLAYPNNIAGVIYQPGAFAAVHYGSLYQKPWASSLYAARIAISGLDPSNGSLKYWDPRKTLVNFKWSRKINVILDGMFFGS